MDLYKLAADIETIRTTLHLAIIKLDQNNFKGASIEFRRIYDLSFELEKLCAEEYNSKGDWKWEPDSGYAGYRCQKCGTWVYENQRLRDCKCNQSKPTFCKSENIPNQSKSSS